MQPFFSIVIPLYNKENYIENTLKSVLNQNFQNFEVVIVNDGSTDNSIDIVRNFADERINIIEQENLGLSEARNVGIKKSKYNFIAFLDADDLWKEDYLETMAKMIPLNNSHKVFATGVNVLTPNKKVSLFANTFNIEHVQIVSNYFIFSKNIFCPSSLVIHKNVIGKVGGFDNNINYGEDEDFFIRCFSVYNLVYYNKSKVFYRKGFGGELTSPNSDFQRIIPNYMAYLNDKNRHILKPYIDFVHYKLVILFKMEKNYDLVKFYKTKIDVSNLTLIQKIKYHLPIPLFYLSKSIYVWFSKRAVHS